MLVTRSAISLAAVFLVALLLEANADDSQTNPLNAASVADGYENTNEIEGPISLHLAVQRFNRENERFKSGQPPLTEAEVIAAIRAWKRPGVERTPEELDAYEHVASIAESGEFPVRAHLQLVQGTTIGDYTYQRWQILLAIETEPDSAATMTIRDTWLSSRKLRPEERRRLREMLKRVPAEEDRPTVVHLSK